MLQLKAIVTGLDLLMVNSGGISPTSNTSELALGVTLLLALFSILFGTRHLDATEHHRGWWWPSHSSRWSNCWPLSQWGLRPLADPEQTGRGSRTGDPRLFAQVVAVSPGNLLELAIYTVLAMCAVICLPRQFHVTVVENNQGRTCTGRAGSSRSTCS